jgi:hypothetical protein
MPRIVIALLLCGALAAAAATRLSAAPPTTEQLRAALLKPEDAGQDFTTEFERATGDNGEVVVARYVQIQPRQVVSVMLTDAGLGTPEDLARSFLQGVAASANVETLPAPAIGRQPARHRHTATAQDADIEGELIAWRQGDVLALVSLLGGTSERLWSLVDRQQARLYVIFTPAISCATFTWQEEAQAALALDPADPHGLDPTRSGLACSELAKRTEAGATSAATPSPAAVMTATPTATAVAPTPTATPANSLEAVRALIGQPKEICTPQNRLRTTIESAIVIPSPNALLGREVAVLIVQVVNLGPAIQNVPLWLVNAQNRGYSALPQRMEPEYIPGSTRSSERLAFDYTQINLPPDALRPPVSLGPGQSTRVAAAFSLPDGFQPVGLWGGRQCPP